jgi:hypothetical protein
LPDLFQTGFIDIDDNHRPYRLHARPQHLKEIESADAQFLKRTRVGEAQWHECNQKRKAHRSRDADLLRPSGYAFHCLAVSIKRGIILSSPARQGDEDLPIRLAERALGQRRTMAARGCYFSRNARMS